MLAEGPLNSEMKTKDPGLGGFLAAQRGWVCSLCLEVPAGQEVVPSTACTWSPPLCHLLGPTSSLSISSGLCPGPECPACAAGQHIGASSPGKLVSPRLPLSGSLQMFGPVQCLCGPRRPCLSPSLRAGRPGPHMSLPVLPPVLILLPRLSGHSEGRTFPSHFCMSPSGTFLPELNRFVFSTPSASSPIKFPFLQRSLLIDEGRQSPSAETRVPASGAGERPAMLSSHGVGLTLEGRFCLLCPSWPREAGPRPGETLGFKPLVHKSMGSSVSSLPAKK